MHECTMADILYISCTVIPTTVASQRFGKDTVLQLDTYELKVQS